MPAMQDFRIVFGRNAYTLYKRLYKGLLVLTGMMLGKNVAAKAMPIRLQIEITDKCNFNCIMCNRLSRENVTRNLNSDISFSAFEKLIESPRP